jgi:2-polyprenyl-3-methyl-5-hydroxy-6-metoxy-1,4-benzoquinol methylase
MIRSHSLIFSDFNTGWYKRWAKELKQNRHNLDGHKPQANKFWQNAVMAQAFYERGLLKEGSTCVGFGVGRERLPALFAKHGVKVLATDQDYRTKKAKHWQKHELATGAQSLNKLSICDPKKFKDSVSYRAVDMNHVPKALRGKYDFVWSNCALGHLGSVEDGLKFILESAKCLKPGGVAVHTTEVNVLSNGETLDNNKETVIFRPLDIHVLSERLRAAGYELSPLRLNFGGTEQDQLIDMSPQFGNDHSKLQIGGHLSTQVVLVINHAPGANKLTKGLRLVGEQLFYKKNLVQQKKFAKKNAFLRLIREYEETPLTENSIQPVSKTRGVTLKSRPKEIYLEYKNVTGLPVFGMHHRFLSTKPIALATSSPEDRKSKFKANDWFNNQANRPSINLCVRNPKKGWVDTDYLRPGATFAYRVKLDPSKVKKGTYLEKFTIVQEGNAYIKGSEVSVKVKVV